MVANVTSARSPRRLDRAPVSRRRSGRGRGRSRRARSAAWTWNGSLTTGRGSGRADAIRPSAYARASRVLRRARRVRSTARAGTPRGCPANRSPPTCVLSQVTSANDGGERPATSGRPRSAQQGSRRPWVQTTKSGLPRRRRTRPARADRGARASSILSRAVDPSQASRVSTAKQMHGAVVVLEARGPACGSAARARRSGARGPGAPVPSPSGSRASRSPSRPHGPACSISNQCRIVEAVPGERLVGRQAPQRAAIAERGQRARLSVRRGS